MDFGVDHGPEHHHLCEVSPGPFLERQESKPRGQCCIVFEASFLDVDFMAPTTTTPSIRDLLPQPSS